MIDEDSEEQRITRIARALCRSARIDPDASSDDMIRAMLPEGGTSTVKQAWMAFREPARAFAARYPREIVGSL